MVTPPVRSLRCGRTPVSVIRTGAVASILKRIRSGPRLQLDSVIAARRVQRPRESAHAPSPGAASAVSDVLVTVKVAL